MSNPIQSQQKSQISDNRSNSILEEFEGELCSISDHDSGGSPRSGILSSRSKAGTSAFSRISSMSSVQSHASASVSASASIYNLSDMHLENDIDILQ